MKTLVTEKESPGNLEEILRVKPKVEIVYQAIKYTGDNIHDIYRIFNGREIQFKVEDGWDGNISLRIKDHIALRVQRDSISMYWESLPSGNPVEVHEGDYILFADDSWTIVKRENFNNEYVITDDIEELIYIHKDMADFKFLGTKSAEITIQFKDK